MDDVLPPEAAAAVRAVREGRGAGARCRWAAAATAT